MNKQGNSKYLLMGVIILGMMITGAGVQEASAAPFDSGSTCIDTLASTCLGTFTAPTPNTIVTLPANGILDYTTFNIPAGYTVTFTRNAANTPVMIRTTGTVTILGTINVSASTAAASSGTSGDGNFGDDGQPGLGGPGGYDGGFGGYAPLFGGASGKAGGAGKGPGGGQTGKTVNCGALGSGGGGGSFGTSGVSTNVAAYCGAGAYGGEAGSLYGQSTLLPLIGGSGGGGGAAGTTFSGSGGGGGGGAILISAGTASSPATIYMGAAGRIFANGGAGGASAGSGSGGGGGGGSGGAIRLVADTLNKASGALMQAVNGIGATNGTYGNGGNGGDGIIRLESNTLIGWVTGNTTPAYTFGLPGHVLVPNSPTLVISSVTPSIGGPVPVPANPTGNADIIFPEGTTTVTVNLTATNIPIGTPVRVDVVPASGAGRTFALSPALAGASDALTTATATVILSPGNNVLLASATYSVTEIIAFNLPTFDDGIRVAKIRVESTMGGESKVTYITASGKEYPADSPLRDKPKV